jgi:ribosomal protein S18 acetylase RimI-like enzyme
MEILKYDDSLADDLKRLSYAWLVKYELLEPADDLMLSHPLAEVIDKGGEIFFAKRDNTVAGTVSMIRISDVEYEMAKLSVDDRFQGKGIGSILIQQCIDFAKEKHARKIILSSNRKLTSALRLYYKFGFVEVNVERHKYITEDINMELIL